ncbi:MAG: site-2 protease family protein [Eubacteriales bacterium]
MSIRISAGFLLLFAWLNYLDHQWVLPWVMLACLIHEMGHYYAIVALGGRVKGITITAVGAEMEMEGNLSYGGEFLCALAGPVTNFLFAWGMCHVLPLFAGIHLALGLFNLIPLLPLDGGRGLQSLLCRFGSPILAERILEVSGGVIAIGIAGFGVLSLLETGGVTLLVLGCWLVTKRVADPLVKLSRNLQNFN